MNFLTVSLDPDRRPADAREFAQTLLAASAGTVPVGSSVWPVVLVGAAVLVVFVLAAVAG